MRNSWTTLPSVVLVAVLQRGHIPTLCCLRGLSPKPPAPSQRYRSLGSLLLRDAPIFNLGGPLSSGASASACQLITQADEARWALELEEAR